MPTAERERALMEESLQVLQQSRDLMDAADAEKRDLTTEEQTQVDTLLTEYDSKKGEANKLMGKRKQREKIELGITEHTERTERSPLPVADDVTNDVSDDEQRLAQRKAFERYLRGGERALGPEDKRVLIEGSDEGGGFLVPEDFRAELIKRLPGLTIIRARATVGTTSRDTVTVPKVTGGDDMFSSGVQISWAGETMTDDEGLTEPGFGQERIPVNKMIAKTRVSKDLLSDSAVDVNSLVTTLYGEAVALGEDQAFITGSGQNRPEGILSNTDIPNTNDVFNDLLVGRSDAIIDVFYAVAQQYRNQGVWVMRSVTEARIRKLKNANDDYIWQPGLQAGAPGVILGRPVMASEFMPADAQNNKVLVFGDIRGYWIFDRMDMELQRLDERYAEQGLIGFVLTRRLAGQVTMPYMFRTLTRTGA